MSVIGVTDDASTSSAGTSPVPVRLITEAQVGRMRQNPRINLEKVKATLNTICPKGGVRLRRTRIRLH